MNRTGMPRIARLEAERVVLRNGTTLPAVCLKCGERHGVERRRQKFVWSPQWALLLVLVSSLLCAILLRKAVSILLGVIISLLVQKRSEFQLPLCSTCRRRWKRSDVLLIVVSLSIVAILPLGMASGRVVGPRVEIIVVVVGAVAWIVGTVVASARRTKAAVTARKIDEVETWLEGVHPDAARVLVDD